MAYNFVLMRLTSGLEIRSFGAKSVSERANTDPKAFKKTRALFWVRKKSLKADLVDRAFNFSGGNSCCAIKVLGMTVETTHFNELVEG